MTSPPDRPKIYHIIHVDRLSSVIANGGLLCDAIMGQRPNAGTTIGMGTIKQRRLGLEVMCRPELFVGDCVPFYFCPRSIMLFLIYRANDPDLTYRGGQGPIVHLESDLHTVVNWAEQNGKRWAFTLSNAGAYYFEDRCNLTRLTEIDWDAITTNKWSGPGVEGSVKEGKQAEFLIESSLPWVLVERIGVLSWEIAQQVVTTLEGATHRPVVEIKKAWYY